MEYGVKVMPKVLSFLETSVKILVHEPPRLRGWATLGLDSEVTDRYKY